MIRLGKKWQSSTEGENYAGAVFEVFSSLMKGVRPAQLYCDSEDGRPIGRRLPWVGTPADIFVQAQFPLHSGRIVGLPGRIPISIMGLVVAALSTTGVVIWWRKRRARVRIRETAATRSTGHLAPAEQLSRG